MAINATIKNNIGGFNTVQASDLLPSDVIQIVRPGDWNRKFLLGDLVSYIESRSFVIQDAGASINEDTDLYISASTQTLSMPLTNSLPLRVNVAAGEIVTLEDNGGNTFKTTGTNTRTVSPGTADMVLYGTVWIDDL